MIFTVTDSANGDRIGWLDLNPDTPAEEVLERLVEAGYIYPAEDYHMTTDAPLAEVKPGSLVVLNFMDDPVVVLEAETPADDDEDEDEELDEGEPEDDEETDDDEPEDEDEDED